MRLLRSINGKRRRAVAAAELALLLPFLCFLFVTGVDYARLFYFGVILENCARNGAYYASDYPNLGYLYNDIYGYKNLDDAVLRDASDMCPKGNPNKWPTYTVFYGTSASGPFTSTVKPASDGYVQVTVTWTFNTITNYPAVPTSVNLSRSTVMKMSPAMPNFP